MSVDRRGVVPCRSRHTTTDRGTPALRVSVVPDSGTGALTGLSRELAIIIADGVPSYEFVYELP